MPSKERDEAKVDGKGYTLKDAIHGNIMTVEALINVLVTKGFITRDEVMAEINRLQAEIGKKNNYHESGNVPGGTKDGGRSLEWLRSGGGRSRRKENEKKSFTCPRWD